MSDSVSCIECGSVVPADAPDGICPACLWKLGLSDLSEPTAEFVIAPSTAANESTFRTTDGLEATASVALLSPPVASATAHAAPLRRLGNYDLVAELGRGGMGVVYKAVQRRADRLVAVKLILGGAASGDENRERFASEVQALAKLRHPNIVPVYEVGDEEGCPYFSMEYMAGGSLAERAKRAPLPPAEAARIVEQLAAAVHVAHAVGVLHRDIKPGNVLLDEDGTPKLTDFGLAKRLDRDEGLTHTGSVLGTPGYMPPEQARGERDLSPAADVYSLGATLFALLAGRPPFAGQNFHDTLQKVLSEDAPRLRTKRPEVARDLEAVCLKCLEKDPARRYATAQALADDLTRWRTGESTIARPQTLPQRAARQLRQRWRAVAIACALVAAIAAAIVINRLRDPLLAIDTALRRGEKVTLIGERGGPRWQRWEFGAGTGGTNDQNGFEVLCTSPGFIELVPRTHQAHYRFSAEFKAIRSIVEDSWAGLYFGRVGAAGPESSMERSLVVRFRDDRLSGRPAFPGKGDPLSVQDTFCISMPDDPALTSGTPLAFLYVDESVEGRKPNSAPWRRVVVELGAAGFRVQFFPDIDAPPRMIQPDPYPWTKLHKRVPAMQDWLATHAPRVPVGPLEFVPQGGCGLYVHNATIAFRNVVLEPLP